MNSYKSTLPASDGTPLVLSFYPADGNARGILALIHGLGDYSGCFTRMIDFFVNHGFSVAAIDMHGNGAAGGQRGHIDRYDLFYEDIELLLEQARAQFGDLPIVLYGHSLGGNLVLNYSLRRRPLLAGVVSSAPLLRLKKHPALTRIAAEALNLVAPRLSLDAGIDTNNLTHDPQIVEEYIHDPLVHGQATMRLLSQALRAGCWAQKHASEFPLPLLLIHGGADSITDPAASAAFAKTVAPQLVEFRLFDGLFHTLHNEVRREEVYQTILAFFDRVIY